MCKNEYLPFLAQIVEIIKHTNLEFTFRLRLRETSKVKPGQFFQISIPMVGEAPISVSGIGEDTLDFTIRKVGKVTNEIFKRQVGDQLFLRGPYGNGFDVALYKDKALIIVAGGTGLSPVKGVVDYFANHLDQVKSFRLIAGFKSTADVLFKEELADWQENFEVLLTVDEADETYTGHQGFVTALIPGLELSDLSEVAVIAVGPPMMMHFTVQEFLKRDVAKENIWISQERNMSCGIGICGHCKIDDVYICLDGPVFNYTKGELLID